MSHSDSEFENSSSDKENVGPSITIDNGYGDNSDDSDEL